MLYAFIVRVIIIASILTCAAIIATMIEGGDEWTFLKWSVVMLAISLFLGFRPWKLPP